jgi:cytochrome c oxidase assembly protein subunit 15
MKNNGLHRFCIFLAVCTLLLVVAGGLVTSNDAGLSVPDWPLSYGKLMPPMVGGILYEHGHRMIATTVGLLTIILVAWLSRVEKRRWLRRLGWIALAAVVVQGVLGGLTVLFLLPKPVSIGHACLAELFFSTTVAIALFTSSSWKRGPRIVDDTDSPPLHWLAVAASAVVLTQVALGAAARHSALGLIPHVVGAAAVVVVVLWVSFRILVNHPNHPALRKSALLLLGAALLQVFLGVAAYMSRVVYGRSVTLSPWPPDSLQPMPMMVLFTVAHVAVGALTLAASVVLAIQVFRNVRRPRPELASSRVTVTP